MAKKETEDTGFRKVATASSIAAVVIFSAVFMVETWLYKVEYNNSLAGLIILTALIIVIAAIRYSTDYTRLAFNIPLVLFLFYTGLMMVSGWNFSHYLLACFAFCGISCVYSNFNKTVGYVVIQNILIGVLLLRGTPVAGQNIPQLVALFNWSVCLFGCVIMLLLTKSATVALSKALENQYSFRDLLATTENYVAMVDERNEIVYASKTLARLGSVDDATLVQGWPLIDLFPERTLKVYAGKMLKEKDMYAADWEFSLHGQKRYFKAASHALPGHSGDSLISLYDMTHLAERDEIAAMKDSMKIGLFFMDQHYIIQDHYSRYLEEMLVETDLFGQDFTEIIKNSVTPPELEAIKDYFGMLLNVLTIWICWKILTR
jgi:hypothetical protein